MEKFTALIYLSKQDLIKIVIHFNKRNEYKQYLFSNKLEDKEESLVEFIKENVSINQYHMLIQDIKKDVNIYGDNWLDEGYCLII